LRRRWVEIVDLPTLSRLIPYRFRLKHQVAGLVAETDLAAADEYPNTCSGNEAQSGQAAPD
jgi:hypothetical protein